ncbi:hypothetical protein [Paludisphaera mucosa]|uniref:Uncharacterized protein n=1 Tax=Paludisphaera mucosa TaxID=3030827 RepID=A0ABT6FBI1_9BACT|nr:hypothetical protein [Paludisphaera mucosa]MDG3004936.1 hypothetical protein [Paludisphaera mucosa]
MLRIFTFNVLVLSASLVATALGAGDEGKKSSPVTAKAAFDRLKTVVGEWKNSKPCNGGEGEGSDVVRYKLTGAGSALVETSSPDTPMEMISVYHLDGDDLKMTHYCAIKNQPRLKLDRAASTADRLVFVFDGGANIDPSKDMYISGLVMNFHPDGKIVSEWDCNQGAEKVGPTTFELTRAPK